MAKKKNRSVIEQVIHRKACNIIKISTQLAYREGIKISHSIKTSNNLPDNNLDLFLSQCIALDSYFEKLHKLTSQPSCKKKCFGCCKYPIWISEIEYLAIENWINHNLPSGVKSVIDANLKNWNDKIGEVALKLVPGTDVYRNEYTYMNIKCPFLLDGLEAD